MSRALRRAWQRDDDGSSTAGEVPRARREREEQERACPAEAPNEAPRARREGGSNSVVESQPSKLLVAGSIPVSRSSLREALTAFAASAGGPDCEHGSGRMAVARDGWSARRRLADLSAEARGRDGSRERRPM